MSGELENGASGQYAYYMFNYPGANKLVTINLQVSPDDSAVLDRSGFRVYGPTKNKVYAQGGVRKGLQPNIAGDLRADESGTFLIQVYNSHPISSISYTLSVDGIPLLPASGTATVGTSSNATSVDTGPAAAAPVVAPPVPASPTPTDESDSSNSFKGRLEKGSAGNFATFEFNYPGDESVYTLNLNLLPDEDRVARAAGFKIYGPQKDKIYVTGEYRNKKVPNVSGDLITKEAGMYLVQVYNFSPDTAVDYEVSLVPNPPTKR